MTAAYDELQDAWKREFHNPELQPLMPGLFKDISSYNKMKQDLLQGQEPSHSRPKNGEFVLIRFVKDVPSIIGVDLKAHGPFHKEDVAKLPQENADSLVRQGAAVEITASNRNNE